jgi:predicted small metal-binding protein
MRKTSGEFRPRIEDLKEGEMVRIVNCPCGHTPTGEDDDELFVLARQHVKEHHQNSSRSEDAIRPLVTQVAQDA